MDRATPIQPGPANIPAGDAPVAGHPAPVVITVHGTFASDASDEGSRWWQRGSEFAAALSSRLIELGLPSVSIQPFRWSGLNSDSARLLAAEGLSRTIHRHMKSGHPVAVLAHSHGGNVILEALAQRATKVPLAAVVTLGTPYFTRRLKPVPTLIAAFKVLMGVAVMPAMLMYVAYAFPAASRGTRIELLALALLGVCLVGWALVSGARTLMRQRRARIRASRSISPRDWLAVHSPRDEAIRLLTAASAIDPNYVTREAAHGQLTRLGTLTALAGTVAFLVATGSYFAAPIIQKLKAQDLGGGILADLTFLLVVPVVYGLVYGAVWLVSRIVAARALAAIMNLFIHAGVVGAAYGGDDAYALTGVSSEPPYLPGAQELRLTGPSLGGIDEHAVIDAARWIYTGAMSDQSSQVAFGDPDLLWTHLCDALYHNAYMRDADVAQSLADHLAPRLAARMPAPPSLGA
jgi:hypothetical protein